MGLVNRKKSGKVFAGSTLNVPGQGIYVVKNSPQDKVRISPINENPARRPTPTPTPIPPTPTPTPSSTQLCLLAQENYFNILTEDFNFILVDCPPTPSISQTPIPSSTTTPTPTPTPTNTETPTPTPTPTNTETPTPTPTPTITPSPTFMGIDPASLSPILYYQTFDTNYLVPSTPNTGDGITQLYKYSDSGQTATGVTSCVASYENLNGYDMLYFPGGSGGCWPPPCTGTCSTSYVATDDINFMHQSGYSFTMYIVARPSSGSTTGGTGFIFSNIGITTPLVGEEVYIDSNFDVKLLTRFATGGPGSQSLLDLPIEINGDLNTLESKSLRIFSVIASDTFDTVTTAATSYVNGIEVTGVTQSNVNTNVVSSSTSLKIGDGRLISPFSDPYGGHLAEIIIFNSAHNITTHNNIILFLKNRWGIT